MQSRISTMVDEGFVERVSEVAASLDAPAEEKKDAEKKTEEAPDAPAEPAKKDKKDKKDKKARKEDRKREKEARRARRKEKEAAKEAAKTAAASAADKPKDKSDKDKHRLISGLRYVLAAPEGPRNAANATEAPSGSM